MKNTHLEDPPRRTLVNPHCLVQRVVERGVVVSDFLPQRLLGLGLVKVGRWRTGMPLLLPGRATATSGACRPAHDDEASEPCVGCCGITQPSSRISSTPTAGSGAGVGRFSHWPHPGGRASSSGISTTAARSPVVGTGAGGTVDVVVAAVVVAAAATASCRDPVATAVPRDGSLVPTALPAARGTLDELRLVGTDASDLSTLVGARAGTVGATL
jgi:hypothetical protein